MRGVNRQMRIEVQAVPAAFFRGCGIPEVYDQQDRCVANSVHLGAMMA